ncbi:hypothetical protein [Phyllobacterium phragmitis]|uniref:Uncharacterized protein n=1 Tax=Phyllobacterium phragmitis TaxID=2670329 RepID=A0ABQ0GWL9_9HYPH
MPANFLSGEFVSLIIADSFFENKYQKADIFYGSSSLLTVSTSEKIIEGGEVYDLKFSSSGAGGKCLDGDKFEINAQVKDSLIFQRAEWYSTIDVEIETVGGNPRILQWSKINNIPVDVKEYAIITFGYLLRFEHMSVLVYASDYPGCIEVATDQRIISLFYYDYTMSTLTA